MNKKIKITAKVVLTFILVALCLIAMPLLFMGDSPPFQAVPEYYFLKAVGIKLVGILIIGVCGTFVQILWEKPKQLA
jgi:hypothetical protein